jgi:hypothetical protein
MIKKHFLNFILYLKQENVTIHDAFVWNWPTYALCGDVVFHCVVHQEKHEEKKNNFDVS